MGTLEPPTRGVHAREGPVSPPARRQLRSRRLVVSCVVAPGPLDAAHVGQRRSTLALLPARVAGQT